ncbi:MAG TPA: hypothetical protein VMX56_08795 [Anaerolineales bacterium]|nr:hypothetical protein [Anaerolineales bacterium]
MVDRVKAINRKAFESAESASPVLTRLIAGVLSGNPETVFNFNDFEKVGLTLLNRLPVSIARALIRLQFRWTALSPRDAENLLVEQLIAQRLADYDGIDGTFHTILIGSAMGGATAHLAAVLGVPFLPQPFILGLRGGSPEDEVLPHLTLTSRVAERILDRNPELMAIGHFDPIHDGWLTRVVSHLRLKLIDLPRGYREFLGNKLKPGGTIVYLDCDARWLHYRLGSRQVYQIGGWGGISPGEFIEGSERIDRALAESGSKHRGGWGIPDQEPVEGPESEWGSEPGLDQALEVFAREQGYGFERITFEDPHGFSRLAFLAHEELYRRQGREAEGVVVETFTQYDPQLVLSAGLLPLWLIFNTTDSREFLETQSRFFPRGKPVYFSGLVTLSRTPDMVPWEGWAQALEGFSWTSIGARPSRYPEDLISLWRWTERLRDLAPPSKTSKASTLPLSALLELIPQV